MPINCYGGGNGNSHSQQKWRRSICRIVLLRFMPTLFASCHSVVVYKRTATVVYSDWLISHLFYFRLTKSYCIEIFWRKIRKRFKRIQVSRARAILGIALIASNVFIGSWCDCPVCKNRSCLQYYWFNLKQNVLLRFIWGVKKQTIHQTTLLSRS